MWCLSAVALMLQANVLVLVKEQHIVLLCLDISLNVPLVVSSRVQLVDTKFTISGQFL